jgi:hypothetical protein
MWPDVMIWTLMCPDVLDNSLHVQQVRSLHDAVLSCPAARGVPSVAAP